MNLKKNLFLSILFFTLCCWLASYVAFPYFAFGGYHYWAYDSSDPRNFCLNIILPSLLFIPFIILGNVNAKKAVPIVRFPVLWMVLILIDLAIISFGIFCGVMFIFPYYMGYFMISWCLGMIALLNILVWSVIAFKRAYLYHKERIADAK